MYSFEGDYKRRPVQALGGASKKVNCHAVILATCENPESQLT